MRRARRSVLAAAGVAVVGCTGRESTPSDETTNGSDASPTATATPTDRTPTPPASVEGEWRTRAANPGRTNHAPDSTGPTQPVAQLWRVPPSALAGFADGPSGRPVVADGTLFAAGDDGGVAAIDAASGDVLWTRSVGATGRSPAVVGSTVFLRTTDGVAALDAADGNERWRVTEPTRATLAASHGCYRLDDTDPPTVVAHADDGSERWRTSLADPWDATVFAGSSAVYVSSGTRANVPWKLDAATGDRSGPSGAGADFPSERFLLDGTVYGVDPFFGNVDGPDWGTSVPPGSGAGGSLSGGTERVYYATNAGDDAADVTALARADGTVAWEVSVEPAVTGRPVVGSAVVILPTADGVRVFDAADGTLSWVGSFDGTRAAIVDDLVIVADDGVRALRPP